MLCIPITGPTLFEAAQQVKEALFQGDILEFRLDLFDPFSIEDLKRLKEGIEKPIIFTLRKKEQGGMYQKSEAKRLKEISALMKLEPTYFDLEYDVPLDFAKTLLASTKLIVSYHDFDKTPRDLDAILQSMASLPGHFYKIACHANSILDSLRMLQFLSKHAPLLGMCMGEKGEITRILGTQKGSPWTYSSLNRKTAPGQLSVGELRSIYAAHQLNSHTGIYGLIGGTISQSLSHLTHNQLMQHESLNAVYVKMVVEKEELPEFFSLCKSIGFNGLSVTIPLKESVVPFLDSLDKSAEQIGAVNTILFQKGKLVGYNTDRGGALDAIEAKCPVRNKKVVILGAGGAARAILFEAKERGAEIFVLNRTPEKALRLAEEFGVKGGSLSEIGKLSYDILINTTPDPLPVPDEAILLHTTLMDIKTAPRMGPFLEKAKEKQCTLIFGYEMFIRQAAKQFALWFPSQIKQEEAEVFLRKEILKHL